MVFELWSWKRKKLLFGEEEIIEGFLEKVVFRSLGSGDDGVH